ncbi:hypothetical protein LPW26_15240 [Rhodopseudomonas sp. HC1]|uniref:hypothetical protein n=1 Tax=Rhodopseudomonas infernalis TaxID=2897386 RepID=UPI001EE7ACD8|nr:hypothetical protein [Rhodopseudomonas infernalis]MCG6206005.1 hypothetical protein [Rhodopseudomonas infernalis]
MRSSAARTEAERHQSLLKHVAEQQQVFTTRSIGSARANAATVQEPLDFGIYGFALSRYPGC